MKRTLILLAALAAFGCAQMRRHDAASDPYQNPFYAKYLNTGSSLDGQITRTLAALREDPASAPLHNDLGTLLVQKGFPNDAEREFERAINLDGDYYQAWYNLAQVRAAKGDDGGARRALKATIHHKPGHAAALFQLGLVEEKMQHIDRAVDLYAKAFRFNPRLMEPAYNPRILDSRLVHLALIRMYPSEHARESIQFLRTPAAPRAPQAIVPPATTETLTPKPPSQ